MTGTITETTGGDLPDGLHSESGVEYLARAEGFEGDHLPGVVVLTEGFTGTTGFFRDSKGRGYWMATLNECSCPDFKYRKAGTGALCKHQKELAALLRDRTPSSPVASAKVPPGVVPLSFDELEARGEGISIRNREWAEKKAQHVDRKDDINSRGFNLPPEVGA